MARIIHRMPKRRIPVILGVDVEPDKPFNPRSKPMPWEGYLRAVEFFSSFRPELEASTFAPVHLSWFYRMDPQIAEIHGESGLGGHELSGRGCSDSIAAQ